jgi:hypothetical protein
MTTTAPERTALAIPDEFEPEPLILDWSALQADVREARHEGVIVRDVRDQSVWLLYSETLYRAGREERSALSGDEPRWIHDGMDDARRVVSREDAANYALTRFARRTMGRHESWDPPVIELSDEARAITRHALLTIIDNLDSGFYVDQVDEQAREAMIEWADHANERSREDDMCGVYDSSVAKYNDRVASNYPALRWPEREPATEEREVEITVPYTIEGTITTYVTVEVSVDADTDEIIEAVNDMIDDSRDWEEAALYHVRERHNYPDVTVETSDWELT